MANRHPLILSHPSTLHTLESFRIQRHFSAKKNRTWLLGSHQRLGGECHRLRVVGLDVNVDMTWRRRRGGFREAKKQRHRKRQSKIPPKKQNAAKCSKDLEINMFRYLELGRIFLGPAKGIDCFFLIWYGVQWMVFNEWIFKASRFDLVLNCWTSFSTSCIKTAHLRVQRSASYTL